MSAAYHIRWTDDEGEHREVRWNQGDAITLFVLVIAKGEAEDVELVFSS
jgi:hypothetical protein